MKKLFDALIHEENGKTTINGNIEGLDEEFFEKNIKDNACGKIKIGDKEYWVLKKDNYYILDKFDCIDEVVDQYKQEAMFDGLTKTYNRRELEEFIKKFLHNFLRYKKEGFSILMLDIDFFKKINDTYGHLAGDEALKQMSDIIKNKIRSSDIFGRYGGEEFVIVLPNTKITGALRLAERIREEVEKHSFEYGGKKIKFTVSIGVTSAGLNDTFDTLMARVDEALYEAKHKGRNRIEYR